MCGEMLEVDGICVMCGEMLEVDGICAMCGEMKPSYMPSLLVRKTKHRVYLGIYNHYLSPFQSTFYIEITFKRKSPVSI